VTKAEEVMPTYHCVAADGLLGSPAKAAIAQAITRAHAEVTGAPPHFAQVVFQSVAAGDHYMGGEPLSHDHVFVDGHIRAGRSALDRAALIDRLVRDVARAASLPAFAIWVYIHELPAPAMAEFGHVLPEPGGETAWIESLSPAERQRMQTIGRRS
jgi:phenylpyruvate tautomerase PptA (4-oxalocrotonate tautomerase family)